MCNDFKDFNDVNDFKFMLMYFNPLSAKHILIKFES